SSAIATLKADPQLSSWVRDGLGLHQQRDADHCLFCEQPLPDDRMATLEAHFSTEYEQLLRQLDTQTSQVESSSRAINQISLPNRAELYEDLIADFDQAKEQFDLTITSISEYLTVLIEA